MPQNFNLNLIKAIIGLGNPSPEYKNTYHNAGILFIEYLNKEGVFIKKSKYFSAYKWGEFELIEPKHYMMNVSGGTITAVMKYEPTLDPDKILIVHDDSDLELGKYKFSYGSGAAGHKGVESIIKTLKTKDFWRLRIGVRPTAEKIRRKAETFVLKKITPPSLKKLKKVFEKTAEELLSNERTG